MTLAPLVALYSPAPGSGKSTAAEGLEIRGWRLVKFAAPLKAMLAALLREGGEDAPTIQRMLEGDLKEVPAGALGGKTPRHAMQTLGTEWGRAHIGQNFWTHLALYRADTLRASGFPVVIDDCRFPNEAEAVRQAGGLVVEVRRASAARVGTHASEGSLDGFAFDLAICNDEDCTAPGWRQRSSLVIARLAARSPGDDRDATLREQGPGMNAITPIAGPHPKRASTAFVQVRSGACVDLLVPDLSPVTLEDIATALSRAARFNGHTKGDQPYSVAQHSLHVAEALAAWGYTPGVQLAGLFHDAAEAFVGDLVTPVKRLMGDAWTTLEARLEEAIRRRFGLIVSAGYAPIRTADLALLATERRDLLNPSAWEWPGDLPPAIEGLTIRPLPPSVAHCRWLAAAYRLGARCGVEMGERLHCIPHNGGQGK